MSYPDMKGKKVLAVFAHPDDESFGPGGTLALWARQGAKIHMQLATNGDFEKLGNIREVEIQEAASVLGVEELSFLGFQDGHIANKDLRNLEEKIIHKIETFRPDILLTFSLNGVSGHLDHIAVSSAVTQAFKKTGIAESIYYYCALKSQSDGMQDYFIHFPDGIHHEDADRTIDVSTVWDTRLEAMSKHKSQKHDMERILRLIGADRNEYFLVRPR